MQIFHVTWRRHVDSRVCDKNDVVSGARAFLLLLFVSACKWIPKITVETPWRITASGFWLFYHFPPDMNFLPIISISIVVTLVLLSSGSSSTSLPNDPLLGIAPGGSSSSLSSGVLFVKFVIGQSLLECVGLLGFGFLRLWLDDWWESAWYPDVKYYSSSDGIKCKDGSKKFTRAQLNDDFCDCSDGTDEPGPFWAIFE